MRNFKNLKVWDKSIGFVDSVYRITQDFPREESYGLTNQFRRAAVSIVGNIAEGCGKDTSLDLARYLQISRGSASECEAYIILSFDLKFINQEQFELLSLNIEEIEKMLGKYISKTRSSINI